MDESNYGILKALPHLKPEEAEAIKKKLEDLGVPDEIGLECITLEDLTENELLEKGDATKLLQKWKKSGGSFA